jgi:MFS transporter, DHA2 family, multidrug resistance protein
VLMIIGNLTIPPLANHIRPAYLIAGGLLVAGVGYLIFTLADSKSGPASVRRFATITLRVTP